MHCMNISTVKSFIMHKNHKLMQDLVDDYNCTCQEGYFGSRCENILDLCLPRPCQNGAECSTVNSDYQCTCLDGFEVWQSTILDIEYNL